ncbi:MAG TPA: IS1182 family transposase [Gemmatimonadales bacterium]|nr:IS1182 family transposase [Gemmatimonadales bacterium]
MPTPIRWQVPAALSPDEARLAEAMHRVGKFYVFLRAVRAELFDESFQAELAAVYQPRGRDPLPPALLAMVLLLQAYDQVSDAEAVLTARVDQRWQLVLGCLGATKAPFSQGVLVRFRERLIAHDLDQRLLDRTVALAKQTGRFGWQALRAALDSSPLVGAGRVEDTWNLIGRALRTVATCAAKTLQVPRDQVLREAGVTLLGGSSLKAALDIDWTDPAAQTEALGRLLAEVDRLEAWVAAHVAVDQAPPVQAALAALRRVLAQDLEPDPTTGQPRIRRGVAAERVPSLGDPEMRHGRKSRTRPFTGYKRHVLKLVDADLIVGAIARPANEPEQQALATLMRDLLQHGSLAELLIDRGYLSSPEVAALHAAGVLIRAKAWHPVNGDRFPKSAFVIDLAVGTVQCPAAQTIAIPSGAGTVHFPSAVCRPCAQRAACTTARGGRSIAIHPHEALLQGLRAEQQQPEGRARLRQRTTVEHTLARVGQIQGPKARYRGTRKNTLDVRRVATLTNLQRLARLQSAA